LELVPVDRQGDELGLAHAGTSARTGIRVPLPPPVQRASTSARKYLSRLTMADTADGPSGQIVVWLKGALSPGQMVSPTSRSMSRSTARPSPFHMRYRTFSIQPVPSRHGVHLPHDSWAKNLARRQATLMGSVSWSKTITAPEPSITPYLPTSSMS